MAATDAHVGKEGLLECLSKLGLDCDTHEHPEVFTVEQALPHVSHLVGVFAKNLFLRDKKKRLYLFCAPHDADVKMNDLAKIAGVSGGFRFADESILFEKLGLKQGNVTVFGLINDKKNEVKLVLDSRFTDPNCPRIYFHPMVNTASTGISVADLKKFLEHVEHEPVVVDVSSSVESAS